MSEVFMTFLRLGLTSFGGPVAHIGYFRQEFVEKRRWISSNAYADLVALCQFLPGPSSSQVGMAIGLMRAGIKGSVAAWLGFTLPSAIALILFGLGISQLDLQSYSGVIHGLKLVATAVIAQAIWGMSKSHCADLKSALLGVLATAIILIVPSSLNQVGVIVASAILGILFLTPKTSTFETHLPVGVNKKTGLALLLLFGSLLIVLPIVAQEVRSYPIKLFSSFFQTGSLVFGGGHIVLPLLQSQVVPTHWVNNDSFLLGYGLTQAAPGPLFTFAAYLGAASSQSPNGWIGGAIALVAIFLPSFLMVIGIMPFWDELRKNITLQKSMIGVNAAVVGLLLAAFYNPVWINTVFNGQDLVRVIIFFSMLQHWKLAPWMVVVIGAISGYLF